MGHVHFIFWVYSQGMSLFTRFVVFGCVGATFVISAWVYPAAPALVPIHWNSQGVADGFAPKTIGLFLLPALLLVMVAVLTWVFNSEPNASMLTPGRASVDGMFVCIALFFVYLHGVCVVYTLRPNAVFVSALVVGFSLFAMGLGFFMRGLPRNFVAGIRTPWTLVSDAVWGATHRVGGSVFMASGFLSLIGLAFPEYGVWFVLAPLIGSALFSVAYSYVVYKRLGRVG